MPRTKKFRKGKRALKKPFFRNFLKKRNEEPQTGLIVRPRPKKRKTEPDRWKPPFATKQTPVLKVDKQDLVIVNDPSSFDLGKISASVSIMLQMRLDQSFHFFIDECLERFKHLDWGGVTEREQWINNRRITVGTGIVCGIYTELSSGVQIWITTDLDQGITKICLSDER